jgi:hypothetical protein
VSKRSYRRLALVAGTALAVGSMAPALAANVSAGGSGSASVDLSGVTGNLPSINSLVPMGLIGTITGSAVTTVQGAPAMVLTDVNSLMSGVLGLVPSGSIASVDVAGNSDLAANVLGTGVAVTGVADSTAGLTSGLAAAPGAIVGTAVTAANPVVGTALNVANTAVGIATSAPGIATSTAGGLLNSGLGLLGGSSASGNVNVLASLMGTL